MSSELGAYHQAAQPESRRLSCVLNISGGEADIHIEIQSKRRYYCTGLFCPPVMEVTCYIHGSLSIAEAYEGFSSTSTSAAPASSHLIPLDGSGLLVLSAALYVSADAAQSATAASVCRRGRVERGLSSRLRARAFCWVKSHEGGRCLH